MRVLHVIASLNPSDGGPPAALIRLAGAQQQLGATITIVAAGEPQDHESIQQAFGRLPGFDGVRIVLLQRAGALHGFIAKAQRQQLRAEVASADFVHIHGVWQPLLLYAASMARSMEAAYAVAPHGMLCEWSLRQKPIRKSLALALFWRTLLNGAQWIHVVGAEEGEHVDRLDLRPARVIIPNGVFLEEYEQQGVSADRRSGLPSRYILFLGRLHFSKGLDLLAEAFAACAREHLGVDLVVVGPDYGYERIFRERLRDLGLADRVHILGPLFGAEKASVLAAAESFCLPSRQEGFSMAVLEALAAAKPVVISTACRFPQAGCAGKVVGLDSTVLAQALSKVCADERQRQVWGEAGRALVARDYTWPAIAHKSLDLYARQTVASGCGSRSRMQVPSIPETR